MAGKSPAQLVVEGYDDLYSVVGLMSAHTDWPEEPKNAPVYINIGNGAEEILKDGYLTTFLKSSAIKTFGVMLDADTKPRGRYERIHSLCSQLVTTLPTKLPEEGLVVEYLDQKRFGVWIMPDNQSDGCLETFLRHLVPDPAEEIWTHAIESVGKARKMGSGCRDHHVVKANLYTWLAWQDPPGRSPGESLTKKILDPHSTSAKTFIAWFMNLYELAPKVPLAT